MLENKYVFGAVGTLVVAVLVVIGIVYVTGRDSAPVSPTPPVVVPSETSAPGAPKSEGGPIEDGAGDEEGTPDPTPPPNTRTDEGGDHDAQMPEADRQKAISSAEQFWAAYSIRDPKARNEALRPLITAWLYERMAVDDTYRIPVVEPKRSAVVDSNYTSGVVVTQAADGQWFYVTVAFDPLAERWLVQRANPAPLHLIAKAQKELER